MSELDPVPVYTRNSGTSDLSATLHILASDRGLTLPITGFPSHSKTDAQDLPSIASSQAVKDVLKNFFAAIESKKSEVVALMIESGLVTPDTTDGAERTPLIAATAVDNVRMVQELVDFGADIDAWGKWQGNERTPLMVAAAKGNLTLVKLFVDVFHADDARIAPDGQMALRLAVDGGWREIVDFLPSRRGGGWRRWKTHHAVAVMRMKRAALGIYHLFRALVWLMPKFFLWTIPKEVVILPAKKFAIWCWKNRRKFGSWCKKRISEIPENIQNTLKWAKSAAADFVKCSWRFITKSLPRLSKDFVRYCWLLLTLKIPAAFTITTQWLWQGVKALGHSLSSVALRITSFLHTLFVAVASFFRDLTLKDVWNGFCDVLRAVLVDFPIRIWHCVRKFGNTSYEVFIAVGGVIGEAVWWIGWLVIQTAIYVPERLWIIAQSLGGSLSKGWHELKVWVNPKK